MKRIGNLITSKIKKDKGYLDFSKRKKKRGDAYVITNIAVVYFIPKSNKEKYSNWEDGFTKAVDVLGEDYNITWVNLEDNKPDSNYLNSFDFIIVKSCWNWIVDKYIRSLKNLSVPRGIAISCSLKPKKSWAWFYDVLWYETEWYRKEIDFHPNKFLAFGINSDVFKPLNLNKEYDVLGIGAITKYKRFNKFNTIEGKKKIIIGSTKNSDFNEVNKTLNNDIKIIDYLSQQELAEFINKSKLVYIPSETNGGGERAVLEAMSCGVPVKVEDDNQKLKSLISGNSLVTINDYVFGLKRGIESLVKDKIYVTNLISPNGNLKVGRKSFYNKKLKIKGKQNVTIGSYCSFGENVTIITENHDYNFPATQGYIYRKNLNQDHPGENSLEPTKARTKGPVIIGNDVWIGDDVTILSGVTIGNGACIATKSLVTKDVPAYSIVGGLPAKAIKMRFSNEVVEVLMELNWWNWSDKKIKSNKAFFNLNLNKVGVTELKRIVK